MKTAAIQGIKGSYSEEAAVSLLGAGVRLEECKSFGSAMQMLESGAAEFAVLPVENSIIGRIAMSADLAECSGRNILDELILPVNHVLAGTIDAEMSQIASVFSHPAALLQCSRFFELNSRVRRIKGSDTASSIRAVTRNGDRSAAAIGSRRAAEMYGAKVILEDVADAAENWTKFYLIG